MADKTVTVKPSGGTYTTLQDAITGEVTANANLVTMGGILTISIEGDWSAGADTTAVTVNGFTTSDTCYLKILTNSANRAKASGWDTGRYILNGGASYALNVYDNHVWIDGLQITANDTKYGVNVANIAAGAWLRVSNCRMQSSYGVVLADADETAYIWNCIFSGNNRGVYAFAAATSYIFNCTKSGGVTDGFEFDAGTHSVKNCAVFNNADDFDTTGATVTIDYCATDDGDGTNGQDFTAEATDWNKVFTDYANGDFTLKDYTTAPCCVGNGTDDPGAGLYSDDITGTARTSPWDIGAHEYAAAGGLSITVAMAHYERLHRQ